MVSYILVLFVHDDIFLFNHKTESWWLCCPCMLKSMYNVYIIIMKAWRSNFQQHSFLPEICIFVTLIWTFACEKYD